MTRDNAKYAKFSTTQTILNFFVLDLKLACRTEKTNIQGVGGR
jgi:hypothetical protein